MKKLLLLVLTFCITAYAQKKQDEELMYMVLENFTYQPNTSKLKFDLVIKNNSDKTLYFIKPKNFFFSNHNDYLENTYNLYHKPYYISIEPYKNCSSLEEVKNAAINDEYAKDAEEVVEIEEIEESADAVVEAAADAVKDDELEIEETVIESTETEETAEIYTESVATTNNYYKEFKIIDEIIEIPARQYRKFKNIEIERKYGAFCKDINYNITVDYYSNINPFDYYSIKEYKDYLKRNDEKSINVAFENELKILKKENSSNTENLKNIIKLNEGLLKTNATKFFSNTIEKNHSK